MFTKVSLLIDCYIFICGLTIGGLKFVENVLMQLVNTIPHITSSLKTIKSFSEYTQ